MVLTAVTRAFRTPDLRKKILFTLFIIVVFPRLEALKKEGQAGTTKITQYTRYLTVGLAILQATGIVAMARTGQLFQGVAGGGDILYNNDLFTIITIVICMTAGTSVIMWLGELITD